MRLKLELDKASKPIYILLLYIFAMLFQIISNECFQIHSSLKIFNVKMLNVIFM